MNNTTGVFYSSCALILITFVSYFAVSHSSPAVLHGSKDVISNNTDGSCVKLRSAPDKSITYKCNGEYSEYCTFGRIVPEHTVVKISCNPGYFLLNGDGNETTSSVCIENKWIPAHVGCHKMCDRLYSNQLNVHLECFQGNKSIPCVDNSLISGARVRSSCKYAHRYENYKNTYQEINCGEDGKWDAALIPCISGCEKTPESHFEAPWHVTILYDFEKLLGCFGTIISPRLILTVESCLFTSELEGNANATDYSVVVARYPMYHRLYKVAEFQYFNRTKFTYSVNRSLTPMIVVLKEELDFNSFVSPAHIQWENAKRLDMWNGTVKVPTLRRLASGMFSSHLINILATKPITNSVNFSSHIACRERWTYPYFVTYWTTQLKNKTSVIGDTFLYDENVMCLEFENDSRHKIGSGVVVEENNCNFIRGIMGFDLDLSEYISALNETTLFKKEIQTLAKCTDEPLPPNLSTETEEHLKFWCNMISRMAKTINTIGNKLEKQPKMAGFIDIADYIGWIKKVRDEIEKPILKGMK